MESKVYPWVRVRVTWDQRHIPGYGQHGIKDISLGKGKGNMGSKAYLWVRVKATWDQRCIPG